mmetsp:Transcript_14108/g.30663  ORF Transcript_14108/g.30663 Transcript_14108/m.30663 type:complete len:85 (+) Transcript_14108:2191-2445(+)
MQHCFWPCLLSFESWRSLRSRTKRQMSACRCVSDMSKDCELLLHHVNLPTTKLHVLNAVSTNDQTVFIITNHRLTLHRADYGLA